MEAITKREKECLPQILAANALLMPHGMRIAAIAVVPEFMEDVQHQVLQAERDGALIGLKGLSFVPYFPESAKFKQVQRDVNTINHFLSHAHYKSIGLEHNDGDPLDKHEVARLILDAFGVDFDKLMEEQQAVQARIDKDFNDKHRAWSPEDYGKVNVEGKP